jgi:hypothetical protein
VVKPGYEQVLQHPNAERRKLNFTGTIALEVFLWGNRRKIAVQWNYTRAIALEVFLWGNRRKFAVQKKCKCGVLDRRNFKDTTRLK